MPKVAGVAKKSANKMLIPETSAKASEAVKIDEKILKT